MKEETEVVESRESRRDIAVDTSAGEMFDVGDVKYILTVAVCENGQKVSIWTTRNIVYVLLHCLGGVQGTYRSCLQYARKNAVCVRIPGWVDLV